MKRTVMEFRQPPYFAMSASASFGPQLPCGYGREAGQFSSTASTSKEHTVAGHGIFQKPLVRQSLHIVHRSSCNHLFLCQNLTRRSEYYFLEQDIRARPFLPGNTTLC